jgi:proteasome accessory factor A
VAEGDRFLSRNQFFTENGGAFYYEMLPHAVQSGLLEVATPECRSPAELILYQRAQEQMLLDAIPGARLFLAVGGHRGELSLLKNCRDAFGNTYGPQENYEAEFAAGAHLVVFRIGLTLLLPLLLLTAAVYLPLGLVLMVGMFVTTATIGLAEALVKGAERGPHDWMHRTLSTFGLGWLWLETLITAPLITPMLLLLRATAFRRLRRGLIGHLVSRPVFMGGGTLNDDGSFGLDEKAPAMRRETRLTVLPNDRAVFEMGNLVKLLFAPLTLNPSGLLRLLRRRQRFQLGLSASNMAQHAEYLKVATTGLLLDMAEAGALDDAPRPRNAVRALQKICADPSLQASIQVRDGEPMTALALQRWYLERARRWMESRAEVSLEAVDVVRQWAETLDALEQDPGSLVGRVDWITKQALVDAGRREGLNKAALKKIDLRYHELGTGYFAELEDARLTRRIVDPEAVRQAIRRAPEDTPAAGRARLLRKLRDRNEPVRVAWDRVRIGGRLGGTVIRLDDFRR